MKKTLSFLVLVILLQAGSAFAVPDLQLFVAGGEYDATTQTWVTHSSTFDLYVIGANQAMKDVDVSMALNNAMSNDPNGNVSIGVDGTPYNVWTWGTPNLLPTHGIFPAWYTTFLAGDFGLVGYVGNTVDAGYDPSTMGYLSTGQTKGEFKKFAIDISGTDYVHFDSYFYFEGQNGATRITFAPFSHDAESGVVPEPATLALFGLGSLGMGLMRKFRK